MLVVEIRHVIPIARNLIKEIDEFRISLVLRNQLLHEFVQAGNFDHVIFDVFGQQIL